MKLIIKNRLFYYDVIDENKKVVCKIKSKLFGGTTKEVINSCENVLYTTDIMDLKPPIEAWNRADFRKYIAYGSKDKFKPVISASLSYAVDDIRTKGQRLLFKRPQVSKLKIKSSYGNIEIERANYNCVYIKDETKTIGAIHLCAFKSHYIHCDTIKDSAFLTVIYILASYMVCEDKFLID